MPAVSPTARFRCLVALLVLLLGVMAPGVAIARPHRGYAITLPPGANPYAPASTTSPPSTGGWHKRRHRWHHSSADADTGSHGGTWRPRWWPAGLANGRPGVVIRLHQQRLYAQGSRTGYVCFACSTGARRPTPCGVFQVVEKLRRPSWSYRGKYVKGGIPGNPLGVCWLGLGMPRWWTGAPIGMHGTNAPWVIGHPASHGCIRLRNEDALALYRLLPVGATVWIMP